MSPHRKTSLAAGVLYLLTFVSIPTLALYGPVKGANYLMGSGSDTAAIIGGILEIIVALAGIGAAVVLFPVLKKQNESLALGLVASRILEAGTIFVGVAFILSIVTLRQAGAGAWPTASIRTVQCAGVRSCRSPQPLFLYKGFASGLSAGSTLRVAFRCVGREDTT